MKIINVEASLERLSEGFRLKIQMVLDRLVEAEGTTCSPKEDDPKAVGHYPFPIAFVEE